MKEKPTIKCPQCNGIKTHVTFISVPVTYIRGYGWLDKAGRRRDMNLYKLINDDPYNHMREKGEKDDLANKLRKGGKFNPKRRHFSPKSK
jgi:hypothetical protein